MARAVSAATKKPRAKRNASAGPCRSVRRHKIVESREQQFASLDLPANRGQPRLTRLRQSSAGSFTFSASIAARVEHAHVTRMNSVDPDDHVMFGDKKHREKASHDWGYTEALYSDDRL